MTRCTNPILSIFLGSMLMLAQACDQSPAGEKIAAKPDPGQNIVKVDIKKDEPIPTPSVGEEPTPGNIAPELPPPPTGRPGDEIPNNGPGYGGGSQGALQPVPTGDEDDEDEDEFGVCGNGEQEVLRNINKNCPHLLYGTTTSGPNNPSTLVYFNVGSGQGFNIATISNIHRVSAIDFSPEGFLYGVGVGDTGGDFANLSVFAQIDCQTGEATIIGPTNIEDVPDLGNLSSNAITDINFSSQGQLWAFLANQQYAGTINFSTGEFIQVTPTLSPITGNTQGNGLAFFPFPNNQLYTAGESSLVLIDQTDGEAESSTLLSFPLDLTDPRINAMDNDPLNNTLYVSIQSDGQNNLGILDISISSAIVSLIGTVPIPAPDGLDGLAVNRRYEECDTQAVGTTACIDCELHEANCADGIDDDFDGLTDCEDPDCQNQVCDDNDACTSGDLCLPSRNPRIFECQGIEEVCDDLNPCTTDKCCDPNPDSPHACEIIIPLDIGIRQPPPNLCVFENDFDKENVLGSCEEDGRACTVGKCTTDVTDPNNPFFICFETNRKFIDDPELGCLDTNECTADSCIESWTKEGFESNGDVGIAQATVPWGSKDRRDDIGNVILDNDWQCANEALTQALCFDAETCREGLCTLTGTGMPGSPSDVECIPDVRPCTTSEDCVPELEACFEGNCVDISCPDVDNNECTVSTCNLETGGCDNTPVPNSPPIPCNFEDLCLLGATCVDGECIGGTITTCETQPDNVCLVNTCDPTTGNCGLIVPVPDGTTLPGCESPQSCVDGICSATSKLIFVTSTIHNGNFANGSAVPGAGLAAADAICQARATAASLPGTYKAWLSDSTASAGSRLTHNPAPYMRTDGIVVAVDYAQLAGAGLIFPTLLNPINVDEFGVQLPDSRFPGTGAWTGTTPGGATDQNTCKNWTVGTGNNFSEVGMAGDIYAINARWTIDIVPFCNFILHLYCLQQ